MLDEFCTELDKINRIEDNISRLTEPEARGDGNKPGTVVYKQQQQQKKTTKNCPSFSLTHSSFLLLLSLFFLLLRCALLPSARYLYGSGSPRVARVGVSPRQYAFNSEPPACAVRSAANYRQHAANGAATGPSLFKTQ